MRKLIITEEEKKSILGLHRIVEQIDTSVAPKTWQTMTPAERKSKRLELGPELYQVYRDSVSKVVQDKKKMDFEKYVVIKGFYDVVDDKTFLKGIQDEAKDTNEYKDFNKQDADKIKHTFNFDNIKSPILIVIKKESNVLKNVADWLNTQYPNGVSNHAMLMIDDESDYASINTGDEQDPTIINKKIRKLNLFFTFIIFFFIIFIWNIF